MAHWFLTVSVLCVASCAAGGHSRPFTAPLLSGVAAEPIDPPISSPSAIQTAALTERPGPACRIPCVSTHLTRPGTPKGPAAHRSAAPPRKLTPELLLDPGDSLVAHLRSLVGVRDRSMTSAHFAVATLRGLGHSVDDDLAGTREARDLVSLIDGRNAWLPRDAELRLGDLLVFDHTDKDGAPLIAVVIRQDRRGVIEFLALQRSVIRRGFADPRRPDRKRDRTGRVVNTHVRAGRSGDAHTTRYLAGQLWRGAARLGRRQRGARLGRR